MDPVHVQIRPERLILTRIQPEGLDLGIVFKCIHDNTEHEKIPDLQHLTTDIEHETRSNEADSKIC